MSWSHQIIAPYANTLPNSLDHIARPVNFVPIFAVPKPAGGWNQSRWPILLNTTRCDILSGICVIVSHTHNDHWSWPAIANSCISRWSISATSLCDCFGVVSCAWSSDFWLAPKPNWSGAITLYPEATSPGIIFLQSRELVGVPCTSSSGVPSRSQRSRYLIFCHWILNVSRYHRWDIQSVTAYSVLGVSSVVPTDSS